MNWRFVLLVALPLSIVSCEKRNDHPADDAEFYTSYIHEDLYGMLFLEGSYWKYREDNTGLENLVSVTESEMSGISHGPSSSGSGPSGRTECYHTTYQSSYYNTRYENHTRTVGIFTNHEPGDPGFILYSPTVDVGYVKLYQNSLDYVPPPGVDSIYSECLATLDEMEIHGTTFYNISVWQIHGSDDLMNGIRNLYYVDSIGVIRTEFLDSNLMVLETWDLVEYEVELFNMPEYYVDL